MLNKISHLFAAIVGRQCGGKRESEGEPGEYRGQTPRLQHPRVGLTDEARGLTRV